MVVWRQRGDDPLDARTRIGNAPRPILVNRGVVRLTAEVYAIGLGVTLGDCDDPWIWSGRACDNRRTFKRR
ncbi:MAG: hypothetical protein ACK54K_13000, partial [Gemmatimonadaceae bacterium]